MMELAPKRYFPLISAITTCRLYEKGKINQDVMKNLNHKDTPELIAYCRSWQFNSNVNIKKCSFK